MNNEEKMVSNFMQKNKGNVAVIINLSDTRFRGRTQESWEKLLKLRSEFVTCSLDDNEELIAVFNAEFRGKDSALGDFLKLIAFEFDYIPDFKVVTM